MISASQWLGVAAALSLLAGCASASQQTRDTEAPAPAAASSAAAPAPKTASTTAATVDAGLEEALAAAEAAVEGGAADASDKLAALPTGDALPAAAKPRVLLLRARLALSRNDFDDAEQQAGTLLLDFPGATGAPAARAVLGIVQVRRERYVEAADTLAGVREKLAAGTQLRFEATSAHVEAASALQRYEEVAGMLAELWAGAPDDAARAELEALALELVDRRLSFTAVRGLYETMDRARWPAPLVIYKLARIHNHVREYGESQALLSEMVERYPDHALAQGARELLAHFEQRFKVKPTAVGVVLPLSGRFKRFGEVVLEGIKLALAADGERKGESTIELFVEDSGSEPAKVAVALEKLVVEHHVIAVVGPLLSATARAAAYKAEEFGVPLIALSRMEGLTQMGRYIFRSSLTNSRQAEAIVQYAMEELGLKKFGILYPNHPAGVQLGNLFWDEVVERQGEVLAVESYEANATDFDVPVKKLVGRQYLDARPEYRDARWKCKKEHEKDPYRLRRCLEEAQKNLRPVVNFEALFIPDSADKVKLLAPSLAFWDIELVSCLGGKRRVKRAFDGQWVDAACLLGGNGWNNPVVAQGGGKWVEGAVFVDGFYRDAGIDSVQHFVTRFKETYGRDAKGLDAQSHDAMAVLRAVIEGKTPPKDRNQMAQALRRVRNFPGGSGIISVDPNGDWRHELYMLTINDEQTILPAQLPGGEGDQADGAGGAAPASKIP